MNTSQRWKQISRNYTASRPLEQAAMILMAVSFPKKPGPFYDRFDKTVGGDSSSKTMFEAALAAQQVII